MSTSDQPMARRVASSVSAVSSSDTASVSAVTLVADAVSAGKRAAT
jgi:hypothetical protein